MDSEALAKKVHGELDRWSREEEKHAKRTANILLPRKHDSGLRLEGSGQGAIDGNEEVTDEAVRGEEVADDSSSIKEAPIDISGPWRSAYHHNFWWVVGHQMMHPCRDERQAEKLCAKLKEGWEET